MGSVAPVAAETPVASWHISVAILSLYLAAANVLLVLVRDQILNWMEKRFGWSPTKCTWVCLGGVLLFPLVAYLVLGALMHGVKALRRRKAGPGAPPPARFLRLAYDANLHSMRAFRSLFNGHFIELETEIFPDSGNQQHYHEVFSRLLARAGEMETVACHPKYLWAQGFHRYLDRLSAIRRVTARLTRILKRGFLPPAWKIGRGQILARHLQRMVWAAWEELQRFKPHN